MLTRTCSSKILLGLIAVGSLLAAAPLAARAQDTDHQNPVPAPGTQTQRQAPLPPEAPLKPPVASKTYTKPKAESGVRRLAWCVRQASVADDAWAGLIKAAGGNPERIAARIASINPATDFYWSGSVDSDAGVILNAAVSHPLNLGKPGAPVSLNSGQEIALQPSLDRTGLIVVKINRSTTTLGKAPAGTIPLQVQDRHSYPVSLHSGVPTAIAQATPIDASHVDVLVITATIDNAGQ